MTTLSQVNSGSNFVHNFRVDTFNNTDKSKEKKITSCC